MAVFYRSAGLVITEELIRVRIRHGWRVWVIADLRDFRQVRREPSADRRSWSLGGPALVLVFVAGPRGGWFLLGSILLFLAACAWYAADRRAARHRGSAQLWATRRGVSVLVFERPNREFDAACRGLRRVLERLEDLA